MTHHGCTCVPHPEFFICKNENYELTECNRSGRLDTAEEQTHELKDQIEELFQKESKKHTLKILEDNGEEKNCEHTVKSSKKKLK